MATILETISQWDTKRKIALAGLLVIVISSLVLVFAWLQRPDYTVLYSNLQPEDAGRVIQQLRQMRVPYEAKEGAIYVPVEKVYELRMELASMGLPEGGVVGYEIFDRTGISTTEFVQKVNLRRALQGELARTIRSLQEISDCRVHLSIPERSIFVRDKEPAKASVVVELKPGAVLTKRQVMGIVHLVSSSVEGLSPENVKVLDQRGNILNPSEGSEMELSSSQVEYKKAIEKDLQERVIKLLEPVVGRSRVAVQASVDIDFKKIEETREVYDPEGQVIRSEEKTTEMAQNQTGKGVPGVTSNVAGRQIGRTGTSQAGLKRQSEVVNYEISRSMSRIVYPSGQIQRVTLSVIVDGTYVKDEKTGKEEFVPRSQAELAKYEELIKAAIGFKEERGDVVKVVSLPIKKEEMPLEETTKENPYLRYLLPGLRYLVTVVLALMIFLLVVRPLLKSLKTTTPMPQRKTIPPSEVPAEERPQAIPQQKDG
ncbi:MAG: flagellar M-ring protein FliF [Nitrospirae bacterium]|nr:MAG: flagellar M-ring protein FliF [Nitrospirota bacterium]